MSATGPDWVVGDRLPNVRLHLGDDERTTLHAEFAGRPLWLFVATGVAESAALPAAPDTVHALYLSADVPRTAPPSGWRGARADPAWLAHLRPGVLWQADANLRLAACHALPLPGLPPPPPAVPILDATRTAALAPVLLVPDVFEPDLCAALVDHLEVACAGGSASGVLVIEDGKERFQLDPTIKQRRESPPRDPVLEARMHERLMRRALPEIGRVFNFAVSRRDPFKLLAYPEHAGYFRAHRDNETSDVAHRRFALSVNLNAGAYTGGEFRFPEFGPHLFSPATGGAIVFSCSLLHEVLPVTRGMRYAMTTFLA